MTKGEREQLENILLNMIGENIKVKICEYPMLNRGSSGKLRVCINHMSE